MNQVHRSPAADNGRVPRMAERSRSMHSLIDRAWQQADPPEWPTQADFDDLAVEWTEEEWEAEQARIMDECFGPLPSDHTCRPQRAGTGDRP